MTQSRLKYGLRTDLLAAEENVIVPGRFVGLCMSSFFAELKRRQYTASARLMRCTAYAIAGLIFEGRLPWVISNTTVWPEGDGHYEQAFA